MPNNNKYYQIGIVFIIALVIRILYTMLNLYRFGLDTSSDASEYIRFGQMMVSEGWMVLDLKTLNTPVGPGYPLIFALDWFIFDNPHFTFTIIVDIILNSLTVVVIYLIVRDLKIENKFALFISLWAAVYLQYIRYTPLLNKENIVFFLLACSVYLAFKLKAAEIKSSSKYIITLAFSYTYLIHTDERYLFHLPLFMLFIGLPIRLSSIKKNAFLIAGILVLMVPWLYRNNLAYGRPVILTERTAQITDKIFGVEESLKGKSIALNSPTSENIKDYEAFTDSLVNGYQLKSKGYRFFPLMKDGISAGHIPRAFSKLESRWFEFLELMRPVRFNGGYTGNGFRYWPKWKIESNLIYGLQYGLLLLFFPIGLYFLFMIKGRISDKVLFIILLAALHIALHVGLNHGLQRYRVPIDFVFIIIGGYGIIKSISFLHGNWITHRRAIIDGPDHL